MTQRNPMNERYQSEERSGKTRKSAASAKPVSKAAASVYIQKKAEPQTVSIFGRKVKQPQERQLSKRETRMKEAQRLDREEAKRLANPPTPEYRKLRRIWWGILVVAIVLTGVSFLLLNNGYETGSWIALGIGYALLVAAIIFEFTKIRKVRDAYRKQVIESRTKEATAARKERKAEERKFLAELDASAEARKEQRQKEVDEASSTGFFKGVFGRKKAADGAEGADQTEADAASNAAEANPAK